MEYQVGDLARVANHQNWGVSPWTRRLPIGTTVRVVSNSLFVVVEPLITPNPPWPMPTVSLETHSLEPV